MHPRRILYLPCAYTSKTEILKGSSLLTSDAPTARQEHSNKPLLALCSSSTH